MTVTAITWAELIGSGMWTIGFGLRKVYAFRNRTTGRHGK
jgi:hypothetical protein